MSDTLTATLPPLQPVDVQLREDAAVGRAVRRILEGRPGRRDHVDLSICPGAMLNVRVEGSVHFAAAGPDLAEALAEVVAVLDRPAADS